MAKFVVDKYKNEVSWYNVNFSDVDSVKGLLRLRSEFDILQDGSNRMGLASNVDLINQLEEITCTYIWLDDIIQKVGFNTYQLNILNKYMHGYTVKDLASVYHTTRRNMDKIITNICNNITKEAERQWRKWIYTKKLQLKTKRCSYCQEDLPATEEFFGNDISRKDGFAHRCKKCDSLRKRI